MVPMSAHGCHQHLHTAAEAAARLVSGAAAIAAAAAPANNIGVIFVSFAIMKGAYHGRRTPKPAERQAKSLVNRGGSSFINSASGAHGQPGTTARPFSRSIASTIALTPVSLSTINIVVADLAVISDSM